MLSISLNVYICYEVNTFVLQNLIQKLYYYLHFNTYTIDLMYYNHSYIYCIIINSC